MGGCTSVGVVVFLVVWADLLCLEGLVLNFDEFDHCGGCVWQGVIRSEVMADGRFEVEVVGLGDGSCWRFPVTLMMRFE